MLDVEEFENVFPDIGYTSALAEGIVHNRSLLGGKTFFERLLELLQIKWRRIYPPRSEDQLRELHKRIVDAPIALHYKHCLLFYLLKDLSPISHSDAELATTFAGRVHLERKFWTFVEGLWLLDHLHFETAVGNLTHPSIIPTFPDEIMLALLNRKNYQQVTEEGDILPLAYFNCANPPLTNADVRTEFARYFSNRNVTETFFWIRSRPSYEQKALLEILVEEALDTTMWSSRLNKDVYTREDRAMEFVSLPFDEEEEKWLETFLTEGKGRNFRGAADTVAMRRIATGRLGVMAKGPGPKGRKIEGINWGELKDGVSRGLGPREDEDSPLVV